MKSYLKFLLLSTVFVFLMSCSNGEASVADASTPTSEEETAVPQPVDLQPAETPGPTHTVAPTVRPTYTAKPTMTPIHTVAPTMGPTITPTRQSEGVLIYVTPPSAAEQAAAIDLGIPHMQVGQETVVEGDSFIYGLFDKPGGINTDLSVLKGSVVTVQALAVHDELFWYLVEAEDGSGWVSEYCFVPIDMVYYAVTPEAAAASTLSQLATMTDMNELDNLLEIYDWQLAAEIAWDSRACHSFYGTSWSINPNMSINCIFPKPVDVTFEAVKEALFQLEILYPSAIPLSLYNTYDQDIALYADRLDNGQAVFDLFIAVETEVYWSSVSLGVPGGETVESLYSMCGDSIETFLYSIIQINMER